MSIIHVTDCAGQIANLAENGAPYQNLNIFSGLPITQGAFAETMSSLLHAKTKQILVKELYTIYGSIVCKALTSSIPLKTRFIELSENYKLKYPDLESMLKVTLSVLEHKESILSKSPEKCMV